VLVVDALSALAVNPRRLRGDMAAAFRSSSDPVCDTLYTLL